jgi:hypothetical protein
MVKTRTMTFVLPINSSIDQMQTIIIKQLARRLGVRKMLERINRKTELEEERLIVARLNKHNNYTLLCEWCYRTNSVEAMRKLSIYTPYPVREAAMRLMLAGGMVEMDKFVKDCAPMGWLLV